MRKVQFTAFALSVLVAVVGCGQTATNEPKKLDKLVTDEPAEPVEPAEPLPPAQPVAETPAPAKVAPVEQAAFAEAAADEAAEPATVPPVLLSHQHAALCRVKVGDTMPEIGLPKVLGGDAKLSALYGKSATVVVFWKGDRQMALDELADLGPDVVQKFGTRGVDVVGIAVNQPAADARSTIQKTAANFPQLLDADGKAFDKVGSQKFPWTFVLDSSGKIVWFDLEYSLATRRELQQALLATVR
ncbi:MAG: redoxin domain-containing protein [Pirellulales bacterium]